MDRREQERALARKRLPMKIAAAAAILLLLAGLLLGLYFWETRQRDDLYDDPTGNRRPGSSETADPSGDDPFGEERQTIRYDGQWYRLRDGIETLLLIGLDSMEGVTSGDESYNNDRRADFLLLLVIDKANESCKALHINRDTMVEFSLLGVTGQVVGSTEGQLALSYSQGTGGKDSCRNTARAVSAYLYDTPIDHSMSITMNAVAILNDAVGGVKVTVLDDFTGIDDALVKGKDVTLQGEQALRYVRARSGLEDSSNLHRMERQRQYLSALYTRLTDKLGQGDGFQADVLLKVSEYMVTDLQLEELTSLADAVSGYSFGGIDTVEGESRVGEQYMEFYADEDALQKQIVELFYEPMPAA